MRDRRYGAAGRSYGGLNYIHIYCVGVWWVGLRYRWGEVQVQVLKRGGKYTYMYIYIQGKGFGFLFSYGGWLYCMVYYHYLYP